jgi:hypothetical protein
MREASMWAIEIAICYSADLPNGAGGWRGTGTTMSGYDHGQDEICFNKSKNWRNNRTWWL